MQWDQMLEPWISSSSQPLPGGTSRWRPGSRAVFIFDGNTLIIQPEAPGHCQHYSDSTEPFWLEVFIVAQTTLIRLRLKKLKKALWTPMSVSLSAVMWSGLCCGQEQTRAWPVSPQHGCGRLGGLYQLEGWASSHLVGLSHLWCWWCRFQMVCKG